MARGIVFLLATLCVAQCLAGADFEMRYRAGEAAPAAPTDLSVERVRGTRVLGVETALPLFEWAMPAPSAAFVAPATYDVVVARDAAFTDVLTTGTSGNGAATKFTPAKALELTSVTSYYWRVRAVAADGTAGAWTTGAFDTSLLTPAEWKAQWISAPTGLLRKEFSLTGTPTRATLIVAVVGYYEAYINGVKVGDALLEPGWTTVDKAVLYSTYDVTEMLVEGNNAIGIMMGKAWNDAKDVKAMVELHTTTPATPESAVVRTDGSWKVGVSPITYNDVYNGETYDATLEQPGWNTPGFDDTKWAAAAAVPGPAGALRSSLYPSIKAIDTYPSRQITMPSPGFYVFDIGQHISGWARLRVKGPAGTVIRVGHAEILQHDGSGIPYVEELRTARAEDTYVLAGNPEGETLEPHFTVHGFRYVFVSGLPSIPTERTVTGVHVRTSVVQTGNTAFGHELLNRINRAVVWSLQTNMMSVFSDCDQRDERKGWMGDAALTADIAMSYFDTQAFHHKFMRDILDTEAADGSICDTTPFIWGSCPADPAWGSAYPTIARGLLRHFNDQAAVAVVMDGLVRYMDSMLAAFQKGGPGQMFYHYGDWVPPPPFGMTDSHLTSSFAFLVDAESMSEINQRMGVTDKWAGLLPDLKAAWHTAFFNKDKGCYGGCEQAANAMGLRLGLPTAAADRAAVVKSLLDDIAKNNNHLTTGIIGTKWLLPVLTGLGRHDLAATLATQETYPSWGFMILHPLEPATTMWELWNADTGSPGMDSRNHHMYGTVAMWFHDHVVGIQLTDMDPDTALIVRPGLAPAQNITSASGSRMLPSGQLSVSWRLAEANLCQSATVGATMTLSCPGGKIASVVGNLGTPHMLCASNQMFARQCFNDVTQKVADLCLNKESCSIGPITPDFFGVKEVCSLAPAPPSPVNPPYLGVTGLCDTPVKKFYLDVTIPAGVVASLYFPINGLSALKVTEAGSGKDVWADGKFVAGAAPGVLAAAYDNASAPAHVVFKVATGVYALSSDGTPGSTLPITVPRMLASAARPTTCPTGEIVSRVSLSGADDCVTRWSFLHEVEQACLGRPACTPQTVAAASACPKATLELTCSRL